MFCFVFTWSLVTDLSVSFGREGTDDVASQPRAQIYLHHPVGALRIWAQAQVDLEPTSRHQSSALVGQPFQTANINDPVTSGGRLRYREQTMHPVFQGESLSLLASEHLQGQPQEVHVKICQLQLSRGHYLLRQGNGTSQQGATSHQGRRGSVASGREAMFPCLTLPLGGFSPSLFLSGPLSCLMQTMLVCFLDLSFLLKCLSASYIPRCGLWEK